MKTTDLRTHFSPDRVYRYTLWRTWSLKTWPERTINFICLNPSTADETNDDPTVRRCIGYAKAWQFDAVCVTNVFALRSTDPRELYRAGANPVGPDNDEHVRRIAAAADRVVCAWGEHSVLYGRGDRVREILAGVCDPHYLRLTKAGRPGHPLYLPASLEPILWK